MIGLRPENDRASTSFFSTNANRKTYRFAERYTGRFFVSGVSGSFAKYTKQLKETDQKYLHQAHEKQEKKYVHEPVLEKHQRDELRREAQRLLEMEEQLAQLQRMRELKRQRDRARRKRKLEYMSACCIQRAFRHYALYKRAKSADLIISFLRTVAAQQALSAAFWASSVLKRFAIKSSYLWKERQLVRSVARRVARDSWGRVQEVASLWTLARRRVTDELIFTAVKEGTARATKAALESGAYLRPPKKIRKLKGAPKPVPRRRRKAASASAKAAAGDNAQFFLTECDDGGRDSSGGEGYDDYSSAGEGSEGGAAHSNGGSDSDDFHPSPTRASVRFINRERTSVEDLTASALAALRLSKRQRPAKVFDPSITEHRRIIELHKKKVQEFAAERIRRMQQVDTRREQEERAAAERRLAEEQQRAAAELQKKEFAEKMAQEERAKARMMAKVRADREAARLKKEAQEKAEATECSAMQGHDKPCYQQVSQPGLTRGGSVLKRRGTSTGSLRPISSLRSVGSTNALAAGAEGADWAVIRDSPSATGPANTATDASTACPAAPPRRPVAKPKPAVDQAVLDQQYYKQALPPKRPGVPRMATVVDSAVKQKKEEEQAAAIEQEALRLLEERRAKFTSEEAVRRSRLAVQRRVAARLQRAAEQARAQEESEAEKRDRLQQIAELAALRLKADLEKKKKKEADRRRELGIDTPPDPHAFSITQPGAKARRRKGRRGKVGAGGGEVSESDATLSETEASSAAGSGVAAARYATASAVGQDEPGADQEDQGEGDDGDDSDSLDAVMSGLTRKLRQQGADTVPAPSASSHALGLKLDASFKDPHPDTAVGTRSSSAGANDPSGTRSSSHRNTASGGADPRKPLNAALYTPSRQPRSTGFGSGDSGDSGDSRGSEGAFERADITSAHETYEELMHDFGAEDFLRQGSVVQLFRTDTAGALVETGQGLGPTAEQGPGAAPRRRSGGEARPAKAAKPKIQTGNAAKKPIAIPKQLQNTPYFQHFKKHSSLTESQSQPVGAFPTTAGVNSATEAVSQPSKLPLLARKQQLQQQQQKLSTAAEGAQASQHSSSSPALLAVDEDLLAFQAKQGMKPGKVASLLEMVTKARNKLHRYGSSGLGTDASDTDADTEHGAGAGKGAAAAVDSATGSHQATNHLGGAQPSSSSSSLPLSRFRPASDAQLDAMVPSLQPPTVPQPLPISSLGASFRKTLPSIPLPPLSKDNLAILLKGKHPDSFSTLATGGTLAVSTKTAPTKKASRKLKAGDGAGKEASSKEGATTEGAGKERVRQGAMGQRAPNGAKKTATKAMHPAPSLASADLGAESTEENSHNPGHKRQVPKKVKYSDLRANIARNAGLASGRYATAGEGSGSDDGGGGSGSEGEGEEEEEEEDLMAGWVEEEPRETRQTVPAKEPVPRRQAKGGRSGRGASRGLDPEEEEEAEGELEQEYIRLREQFNAKLQQAAALNQLRQSAQGSAGGGAGAGAGGEGDEEGSGLGLVASGKVTQSYSEGHARISTQDLLRMWELEDAAEEVAAAQLRASQHRGRGEEEADSRQGRQGHRSGQQWGAHSIPSGNQQLSPGTADAGLAAQSQQSSDDDEGLGYGARGRDRVARGGEGSSAPLTAAAIPVPEAAVAIDDPALDEHFLSFMNKMANKITTKQ